MRYVQSVHFHAQLFKLQYQLDHIFAHTFNIAEFVRNIGDADGCNRNALQR